jgi:membrane protease YdiL (CAAX protease family)
MQQLTKIRSIIYHLYPGIVITACFVLLTPVLLNYNLPPQFSVLLAILIIAVPILVLHLNKARKIEHKERLNAINGYTRKISTGKLVLYVAGLVIFMFFIWGIMQPINAVITKKILSWLPSWYTLQDFNGFSKKIIILTLVLNLLINGILAPVVEEYYFRGYLLPRMETWGKWAFVVNAILFSFYHFWQPYVYLTLLIALLPLSWAVWKTKDLRVGIYTHCALNLIGALASFGLALK